MAKVTPVQISATADAIYMLDSSGKLWAYNQNAEWKLIELPDQIPV